MNLKLNEFLPTFEFEKEVTFSNCSVGFWNLASTLIKNDDESPRGDYHLVADYQTDYYETLEEYDRDVSYCHPRYYTYKAGIDFTKFFPEENSPEWNRINELISAKKRNRSDREILYEFRPDRSNDRILTIAKTHKEMMSRIVPKFYDNIERERDIDEELNLNFEPDEKENFIKHLSLVLDEEENLDKELHIEIPKIVKFK